MKLTTTTKRVLKALMKLPKFHDFDISVSEENGVGIVTIGGAYTQADVRQTRALFPGTIWSKRERFGMWSYTGVSRLPLGFGRALPIVAKVTGCREAPPTCRQIEVVEMIEQYVRVDDDGKPIEADPTEKHEYVMLPTKVRKWVCGDAYADPTAEALPIAEGE